MLWKELIKPLEDIAYEAGEMMLSAKKLEITAKGERDYVTQVDINVNNFVIEKLKELLPDSHILTEESDDHNIDTDSYTWVIDPIDGTSNFIFDFHLSCVSIGLVCKNKTILGVVYNPFTDEMFSAAQGEGTYLNGQRISVGDRTTVKESIIICETNPYGDRTSGITRDVIDRVYKECLDYRVLGTAALDICYVACGRASSFVSEGINPWDFAAGLVIIAEAGGVYSSWDNGDISFKGLQNFLCSNNDIIHGEMMGLIHNK